MLSPSKSRRAAAALCLLSLALLGCASVATADTGAGALKKSSSCSDVRPRSGDVDFALGPTCAEIAAKGNCNEGYMQKTIAEMKGAPYCQVRDREREREKKKTRPPLGSHLSRLVSSKKKKKTDFLRPVQELPAPGPRAQVPRPRPARRRPRRGGPAARRRDAEPRDGGDALGPGGL